MNKLLLFVLIFTFLHVAFANTPAICVQRAQVLEYEELEEHEILMNEDDFEEAGLLQSNPRSADQIIAGVKQKLEAKGPYEISICKDKTVCQFNCLSFMKSCEGSPEGFVDFEKYTNTFQEKLGYSWVCKNNIFSGLNEVHSYLSFIYRQMLEEISKKTELEFLHEMKVRVNPAQFDREFLEWCMKKNMDREHVAAVTALYHCRTGLKAFLRLCKNNVDWIKDVEKKIVEFNEAGKKLAETSKNMHEIEADSIAKAYYTVSKLSPKYQKVFAALQQEFQKRFIEIIQRNKRRQHDFCQCSDYTRYFAYMRGMGATQANQIYGVNLGELQEFQGKYSTAMENICTKYYKCKPHPECHPSCDKNLGGYCNTGNQCMYPYLQVGKGNQLSMNFVEGRVLKFSLLGAFRDFWLVFANQKSWSDAYAITFGRDGTGFRVNGLLGTWRGSYFDWLRGQPTTFSELVKTDFPTDVALDFWAICDKGWLKVGVGKIVNQNVIGEILINDQIYPTVKVNFAGFSKHQYFSDNYYTVTNATLTERFCSGNGHEVMVNGKSTCKCNEGYSGDDCQFVNGPFTIKENEMFSRWLLPITVDDTVTFSAKGSSMKFNLAQSLQGLSPIVQIDLCSTKDTVTVTYGLLHHKFASFEDDGKHVLVTKVVPKLCAGNNFRNYWFKFDNHYHLRFGYDSVEIFSTPIKGKVKMINYSYGRNPELFQETMSDTTYRFQPARFGVGTNDKSFIIKDIRAKNNGRNTPRDSLLKLPRLPPPPVTKFPINELKQTTFQVPTENTELVFYKFDYKVPLVFSVEGIDLYLAFCQDPIPGAPCYLLILNGWTNTMSWFGKAKIDPRTRSVHRDVQYMHKNTPPIHGKQPYWLRFIGNKFELGRGRKPGHETVLSTDLQQVFSVNAFSMTRYRNVGPVTVYDIHQKYEHVSGLSNHHTTSFVVPSQDLKAKFYNFQQDKPLTFKIHGFDLYLTFCHNPAPGAKCYFLILNGWGNTHSWFGLGSIDSQHQRVHTTIKWNFMRTPAIHGNQQMWVRFHGSYFQVGFGGNPGQHTVMSTHLEEQFAVNSFAVSKYPHAGPVTLQIQPQHELHPGIEKIGQRSFHVSSQALKVQFFKFDQNKPLLFGVQGFDLYLTFCEDPISGSKCYFFILNGWGNTHSWFGTGAVDSHHKTHAVTNWDYRRTPAIHGTQLYWVRFHGQRFQAGRGNSPGHHLVVDAPLREQFPVAYVAFSKYPHVNVALQNVHQTA